MTYPTLDARIAGIPCQARILSYTPGHPAKTNADPGSCYESSPPEIEYEVLDRRGRLAPWLEAKLIDKERAALEFQLMEKVDDTGRF